MDGIGQPSEFGSTVSIPPLLRNGAYWDDSNCPRQVSPIRIGGSTNTSPLARVGSRNASPSRQKVIKTKPRGLGEETAASFSRLLRPDFQMEDNTWVMLPEDLLNQNFSWGSSFHDISPPFSL